MVQVYHSRDPVSLAECVDRERNQWTLPDELTMPPDERIQPGELVEEHDFTWQVRRLYVRKADGFLDVQARWGRMRYDQRWQLEQPMIRCARFYVKRVVL